MQSILSVRPPGRDTWQLGQQHQMRAAVPSSLSVSILTSTWQEAASTRGPVVVICVPHQVGSPPHSTPRYPAADRANHICKGPLVQAALPCCLAPKGLTCPDHLRKHKSSELEVHGQATCGMVCTHLFCKAGSAPRCTARHTTFPGHHARDRSQSLTKWSCIQRLGPKLL